MEGGTVNAPPELVTDVNEIRAVPGFTGQLK
jgi:hypothetical protein